MRMTTRAAGTGTTTERLLRNRPVARRLHAAVYLLTGFLFLSGLAVLGEGRPAIEALLGGHVAAARWHRWVGFGLMGLGVLVAVLRPGTSTWFLAESARFGRRDLVWFVRHPRFLLRPARYASARHDGHFDPGQRVFNVVVVVSLLVLAVTGAVMSFPQRFVPVAFAASLQIHRAITWVLGIAVAGHLVVVSGLFRGYRGVWRAMHSDGRVRITLAQVLWPEWARDQEGGRPPERPARPTIRPRTTPRRRTRGPRGG
jgi:formate dehydrogenase subunit gamma